MTRILIFIIVLFTLSGCPHPVWEGGVSSVDFSKNDSNVVGIAYTFVDSERAYLKLAKIYNKDFNSMFVTTIKELEYNVEDPGIKITKDGLARIVYNYQYEKSLNYIEETLQGVHEKKIDVGCEVNHFQLELDRFDNLQIGVDCIGLSDIFHIYKNNGEFLEESINGESINGYSYSGLLGEIISFKLDAKNTPSFLYKMADAEWYTINYIFKVNSNWREEQLFSSWYKTDPYWMDQYSILFIELEYDPIINMPAVFLWLRNNDTHSDEYRLLKRNTDGVWMYQDMSQNFVGCIDFIQYLYLPSGDQLFGCINTDNRIQIVVIETAGSMRARTIDLPEFCENRYNRQFKIYSEDEVSFIALCVKTREKSKLFYGNNDTVSSTDLYYGYYDGEWHIQAVETY